MSFNPKMWFAIEDKEFETLATLLLTQENQKVRTIEGSGGDGGIDAYIGLLDEMQVIYQMKNYPKLLSNGQKKKIENSLKTAIQNHRISKWILVIPRDPTPGERSWFEKLQIKYDIELTWFGNNELTVLLYKYSHIRDQYFNFDPHRNRETVRKKSKMQEIIDELILENQIFIITENERNKRLSSEFCWKIAKDRFYLFSVTSEYSVRIISKQVQSRKNSEIIVLYASEGFLNRFKGKFPILPIPLSLDKSEIKNLVVNYKNKLLGSN